MKKDGLREVAYQAIKELIVSCEYKPGEFLDSLSIGQKLNISRTPIREAESILENEGLLRIIPQKGAYVTSISPKVIRDVYSIRKILEPGIIRQMGATIPKEKLVKIKQDNKSRNLEQNITKLLREDDALHRTIIYSTNNQYIINTFEQLCDQKVRINIMSGAITLQHFTNQSEHEEIIDLILDDKFEEAAVKMEEHLEKALKEALNILISQ